MKAVESLVLTGTFPTACTHSQATSTVLSSVRMVCTTSTSFISGTGLKKCIPKTCAGRLVAAAMAVTLHEDVLDARTACGGESLFRFSELSFFWGWFSGVASFTRL